MGRTKGKPGSRGKYYARYLAHYTKKNTTLLVLGAVFLVSIVLGTLLLRSADSATLSLLGRLLDSFLLHRGEGNLYQNFVAAAGSSLLFVGALFVCGFCAISQPVIVLAPFLRGLGFGFSAASLYARYGTAATGFLGVLVVPGMFLSTFAILLCCQQSLRLAGSFFATMRGGAGNKAEPYPVQRYCFHYLVAAALCLLSAFLEAVLYSAFGSFFLL